MVFLQNMLARHRSFLYTFAKELAYKKLTLFNGKNVYPIVKQEIVVPINAYMRIAPTFLKKFLRFKE